MDKEFKQIVFLVAFSVLSLWLTACGKAPINTSNLSLGACQNLISTGTWKDLINGDIMVLNANCSGTTTYCNEKFTYAIQADQTTTVITDTQTNGGPECLNSGTNICTVTFSSGNTLMQISCPSFGTYQYQRQ